MTNKGEKSSFLVGVCDKTTQKATSHFAILLKLFLQTVVLRDQDFATRLV
jgi:hypothetical protein